MKSKNGSPNKIDAFLEIELEASVMRVNGLCRLLDRPPRWQTSRAHRAEKQTKLTAAAQAIADVYQLDEAQHINVDDYRQVVQACVRAVEIFNES